MNPVRLPQTTASPEPVDEIRVYEPSTRPGSPLPHASIDDDQDNLQADQGSGLPGRFLLIAGEGGQDWCEAARQLEDAGVPIDSLRIGHIEGDLFDPRSMWA